MQSLLTKTHPKKLHTSYVVRTIAKDYFSVCQWCLFITTYPSHNLYLNDCGPSAYLVYVATTCQLSVYLLHYITQTGKRNEICWLNNLLGIFPTPTLYFFYHHSTHQMMYRLTCCCPLLSLSAL